MENIVPATVVDTRMVMFCKTEEGQTFMLSGALPKGSLLEVVSSGLAPESILVAQDFDGYYVAYRAPRNQKLTLTTKADDHEMLPSHLFEEVRV